MIAQGFLAALLIVSQGQAAAMQQRAMPNLFGAEIGAARDSLRKYGLVLKGTTRVVSEEYQTPTVVNQSIKAGTPLRRGMEITLDVASKPNFLESFLAAIVNNVRDTTRAPVAASRLVAVPNLEGLTLAQARDSLRRVKLRPIETEEESENPQGLIFRHEPAAGDSVLPGSKVDVFVAIPLAVDTSGAVAPPVDSTSKTEDTTNTAQQDIIAPVPDTIPWIKVPFLIGRTFREADSWLRNLGFIVVGRDSVGSSDVAGVVAVQNPQAGDSARQGATVTLTMRAAAQAQISVAPPPVWPWIVAAIAVLAAALGAQTYVRANRINPKLAQLIATQTTVKQGTVAGTAGNAASGTIRIRVLQTDPKILVQVRDAFILREERTNG